MLKPTLAILAILGILVALLGIGVDYLLPGASPGFNLPQLLIVAAGLTLSFAAIQLRRKSFRSRLYAMRSKSIAAAAIITLLTLLALEIVLTVWGMPTYFPAEMPKFDINVVPFWICDKVGCHYDHDAIVAACEIDEIEGRLCEVNRQGFSDSEDFIPPYAHDSSTRILMLGDSFTFGMSADLGMSYAEKLASDVPQSIIWNAGMTATGTNQALATFEVYGPRLRPQLTTLGFYMNDFDDNLLPLESWWSTEDSEGNKVIHRKQKIDYLGNVVEIDINNLGIYEYYGRHAPAMS